MQFGKLKLTRQTLTSLVNRNLSQDYQYLQNSKIPTMHFQDSLPRLPIPKLELTCERYLAAQMPLLIDEAFRKTKDNVDQFCKATGRSLQEQLIAKDKKNKHTSYISEPWFDMYLKDRKSLPINYNPMMVFINDPRKEYNKQLIRATNLLISSLRFYRSLNEGILEPEVYHMNPKKTDNERFRNVCSKVPRPLAWYASYALFKAFPLDMSQYSSLFNTTRIPETDKDRIARSPGARHVVVQRNGHFYSFDALDESGNILPPNKLLSLLKFILDDTRQPADLPLSSLTALTRNEWATIRHSLATAGNEKTIKTIDTSLFNICLDDDDVGDDPIPLTRKFLHGDGVNRWFDKSFSLIVSKDGVAGLNFEHSWGDGVAVLRYFQDIHKDSTQNPQVHPDTQPSDINNEVQLLSISLNDNLKSAIRDARSNYKAICDSLDVNYLIFDGIGKDICKKNAVSPDAVMQLGFQAAYHRLTNKFVGSYESCSTAAFKHGRTETVRPCTMETKTYSLAVNSGKQASKEELRHLVSQCSKKHSQLTREAAMGQGFDRHLYALRCLAEKANVSCNIFEDPAYATLNYNIISTSTLSSPAVWAGGFGPVVKDGLGIAYVIKDNSLGVLVTNYPPHTNSRDFIESLKEKFVQLRDILGP